MTSDPTAWAKENVTGHWTTLWTPFTDDDALDEDGLRRNVRRILELDTDGLACNWGAGEFWSLTVEERKRITEVLVAEVDGAAYTGVQVGTNHLDRSVELARHAERLGTDVIIVNAPVGASAWNRSEETIFELLSTIAEAVDLPVQYTNWSGCGTLLSSETIAEFTDRIDNLAIVKEAHNDNARAINTFIQVGDRAVVSQPKDGFFLHTLYHDLQPQVYFANPADALFDSPNDAPFRDFVDAALAGDASEAQDVYANRLAPMRELYKATRMRYEDRNPHAFALPAIVKPWVEIRGYSAGDVRSPLPSLRDREVEDLRRELEQLGLADEYGEATG